MIQKMETAYSSKMLIPISQATQHHIPQESNLLNVIIIVLGSTLNKAGYESYVYTNSIKISTLDWTMTFQPLNIAL
jgi:hypothetical protein